MKNFFRSIFILTLIFFTFTLDKSYREFFYASKGQQLQENEQKSPIIQNLNCSTKTDFFNLNNIMPLNFEKVSSD